MSLEDDEKWLGILSGRDSGASVDPRVKREAEALRRAILSKHSKDSQEDPSLDEGSLDRMLFRLKREGLLEAQKVKPRRYGAFPAAIAAMLVLAIVIPLAYQMTSIRDSQQLGDEEWTQMRGGEEIQQIWSDDPARMAIDIKGKLEALGVQSKIDEFEGHWYVDAYLPVPVSGQIQDFL